MNFNARTHCPTVIPAVSSSSSNLAEKLLEARSKVRKSLARSPSNSSRVADDGSVEEGA